MATTTAPTSSNNTSQVYEDKSVRDATMMRDLLGQMNQSFGAIGKTFLSLNQQSAQMSSLVSASDDARHQIKSMIDRLKHHDDKQQAQLKALKAKAEAGKELIFDGLRTRIQEQVRAQIAEQAKQQAEIQVKEHFPVSLQQQSEDCKQQIKELNGSLRNSVSRKVNMKLDATDLDEPLKMVLKADGTESRLYPANLRSLYGYDDETCKSLVRDYSIEEDDVREVNLNRFMAHIGLQFFLLSPP